MVIIRLHLVGWLLRCLMLLLLHLILFLAKLDFGDELSHVLVSTLNDRLIRVKRGAAAPRLRSRCQLHPLGWVRRAGCKSQGSDRNV